jgi:ubiquinone/menaquinone biosynthesis C-methylase UbiE
MSAQPRRRDRWRDTASLSPQDLETLAAFLEHRGRLPGEQAMREAYLAELRLPPGAHVLEAGCGTGVVCRALARRLGPAVHIIGMDTSEYMLEAARRLTAGEGLDHTIEYCRGDVYALPFPDESFDATLAITLLGHLDEPDRALRELVRITRPGGTVLAVDWDQGAVVLSHPDEALTATVIDHYYRNYVADRWAGRKLLGRFAAAGLRDLRLRSFAVCDCTGGYLSIIQFWVAAAVSDGVISAQEGTRWLDTLRRTLEAGMLVYGLTYFACYGTK